MYPHPARLLLPAALLALAAAACAAAGAPAGTTTENRSWSQITDQAKGQTVDLWMYGGDQQGNAYVDDVLTPAAAKLGVTLRRVPVADTKDAMTRILAERQAGTHGRHGRPGVGQRRQLRDRQAGRRLALRLVRTAAQHEVRGTRRPADSPRTSEPTVDGCEAPWHKAQFTLGLRRRRESPNPPTIDGGCPATGPRPTPDGSPTRPRPDFTGSVFVREALYSASGGYAQIPAAVRPERVRQADPAAVRSR